MSDAPAVTPESLLRRVFPPMLATLVSEPPADHARYLHEVKYDGFRALAALTGGQVAMWTRNALDLTSRFPAVTRALREVAVKEAVIDGEIVAIDDAGASRFQLLHGGGAEALFAFDLLWLDGRDVRALPLERRRELLEAVLAGAPPELRLAERVPGTGAEALAWAAQHGLEGVIAKLRGSIYEPRRSRAWLKLKAVRTQELAIVGFTPSKASASDLGALLLGVSDGQRLVFAGKVGTGFSARLRTELRRELLDDAVDAPRVAGAPRIRAATWVEPRLVAQVQFTEWTADGKLRHPSFLGLRPDRTPLDCVRERPSRPPALAPPRPPR